MLDAKTLAQIANMDLGFTANPHPENRDAALGLLTLALAQAGTVEKGQRLPENTTCPALTGNVIPQPSEP